MRRIVAVLALLIFGALLVPAGSASAAPATGELRTGWNAFPFTGFGSCLAVDDNSGDRPFIAPCNAGEHQRFTIDGNAVAPITVVKHCLDVGGGATHDGALVQIWSCNGTGAQLWQFDPVGLAGFYLIKNPQSGRCLSVGLDSNLAVISNCIPIVNSETVHRNNLFKLGPQIF
jgi:hypothetical protein